MKRYKYILFILSLVLSLYWTDAAYAQKKRAKQVISGKVVDQDGNGVAGVLITADEGASKTTSLANGIFKLQIQAGGVMLFEKRGYEQMMMNDADFAQSGNVAKLQKTELYKGESNKVYLPFQSLERNRLAGHVSVVNPSEELQKDTRYGIGTAIAGKVPGMQGSWNLHGIGNATVVIDGVPRSANNFNLQEIEQITILKDPVSRMLYGADADNGVIFITTKHGAANKRVININLETGLQTAISFPKYLNSATYMEKYNEAYKNDGNLTNYFADDLIKNTRAKIDPVLYPDNNYIGSDIVKNYTNFTNFYAETSGGNQKAQYFMNLGWKHNEGWIKAAEKDYSDLMSVRGNVDYQVNRWMKMNADVVAIFNITNSPNCGDFWSLSSSTLPNTSPLLLPISRISNFDQLEYPSVVNGGYLLGGSSIYQSNVYADILRKGTQTTMDRFLQFNTGVDIDLSGITKGLSAKGFLTFDFTNRFVQNFANEYAVYFPDGFDSDGNFTVSKIGVDKVTTQKSVNANDMYFSRNIGLYGTINYDRSWLDGKHALTAVAVAYRTQFTEEDVFQQQKRLNFGVQANYMFNERYIIEGGAVALGSSKLARNNRFGVAPSVAVAWIASNENFLKSAGFIDYLKVRAGYGVLLNDNWSSGTYKGYFLYEPYYQQGGIFNYSNGTFKNNEINMPGTLNDITWQKRKEFTAGFEVITLNHRLLFEASYFNSKSYDNLSTLTNAPATLGGISRYINYNATRHSGFEAGINYKEQFGEFRLQAGVNMVYSKGKVIKKDESVYNLPTNKHLSSVGSPSDAMLALTAVGLYGKDDFDSYGQLLSTLPKVTYGAVQEGDIKYLDYNKDGVINDDDRTIIGNSSNRFQFGITIDLTYKNWQLFILGTGAYGGKAYMNSNYYWLKGTTAKYSEVALQAYNSVTNPDPNAKYPRLTTTNGNNNYRNSTFWIYDKSQFSLATVQLGYNIKFKPTSAIKNMSVYLRGGNLLMIAKNKDLLQLNVGSSPQNRVFAFGVVSAF